MNKHAITHLLAALLATTAFSHTAAFAQTTSVTNAWTGWLNRDSPSGNGDFETLSDFIKERPTQICQTPTAIEARLRGSTTTFTPSAGAVQKFRAFSPATGLVCYNTDQTTKSCSDYEVRFLCAPQTLAQLNVKTQKVEVLQLVTPQNEGNGIALITLDKSSLTSSKAPTEFSFDNDGVITVLNDTGKAADAQAGDLTFSGFVKINSTELNKTTSQFTDKLNVINKNTQKDILTTAFAGRNAVKTTVFTNQTLATNEPIKNTAFPAIPLPKPFPGGTPPALVNPANALAINSTSVVANPAFTFDPCNTDNTNNHLNPNAPFSFKTIISNLNNESTPGRPTDQQFVHNWLRNWMVPSNVNGFTIPTRANIQQYFPGWDGINASTLDMNRLPFRLLSIVNRIDLANIAAYGNSNPNKPGEIRFVFGLLNINDATNSCTIAGGVDQMTAIFEFKDATNSCSSLKTLATDWINLDINVQNNTTPLGSPAYMAALKAITDTVTAPNVNKLNQLRTNDFAFDGKGLLALPWQLREFVLGNPSPDLIPTTIKQTPDFMQFRGFFAPGANTLADYVASTANTLLCDAHAVPTTFGGVNFLGAHTDYQPNTSWPVAFTTQTLPLNFPSCYQQSYIAGTDVGLTQQTLMQIELRHKLSLNACDDCHAAETNTFFTHISPVTRNLSGFMTGITVTDPTPSPIERQFNDIARRNQVLVGTANAFCGFGGPILLDSFQAKQAQLGLVH